MKYFKVLINNEVVYIGTDIYYGEEITEEAAETLRDRVAKQHPDCDIELQYGGQPIYYYIVSAE